MAQILTHPNAIAAENRNAASSTFEINAQVNIGYRDDSSLEYRNACKLEAAKALSLEWAVTINDAWRAGQLVFSDDGARVMNQITQLMAKTLRMTEE